MKKPKLFILGGVIAAGILLTTGVSVVYALETEESNTIETEDTQESEVSNTTETEDTQQSSQMDQEMDQEIVQEIVQEEPLYQEFPAVEVKEFAYDENEYMTEYTYDENHNLKEETIYSLNGDVSGFTTYIYNENGKLIQKDIYNGTRTPLESFIYDGNGNCTKEIHYPRQESYIIYGYEEIIREYDENNRLIKEKQEDANVTGSSATKVFTYDENGYCIGALETYIGLPEIIHGKEVITTIQYNEQGDIINETLTGEEYTILHNYSYQYDEAGKIIQKTYAYNHSHGSFKNVVYEYEYNSNGQLIKETILHSSGDSEEDRLYEYVYDEDGYLIKKITQSKK